MAPDGLQHRRRHCIGKQWARISVVRALDAYRRYDAAGAGIGAADDDDDDDDDDDANRRRSDP